MVTVKRALSLAKRALNRMRPKQFSQQSYPVGFKPQSDFQEFYTQGIIARKFNQNHNFEKMKGILKDINEGRGKSPFQFKEKTPHYSILRPLISAYDDVFIDVLFDSQIPQLIKRVTEFNLVLAGYTYIQHTPGHVNDWHRDTYIYNSQLTGPFPPIYKLIYYPTFGKPAQPQLAVIPGSHHRQFFDRVTDEYQIRKSNKQIVYSADDKFLIFMGAIFHSVCQEKRPEGSYRLHYFFVRESQLEKGRYPDFESVTPKYKERLKNAGLI